MIRLHLAHIGALDAAIAEVEAWIREALTPFRAAVSLLTAMPGVSETAAALILGEIGDDMSKSPSAGYLLSWAGLCLRLDKSNGKRRSTRTRQGAPWLKTTLGQIARLGNVARFETVDAETRDVAGTRVRVATPGALYRLKKGTSRAKDHQDAAMLRERFDLKDEG